MTTRQRLQVVAFLALMGWAPLVASLFAQPPAPAPSVQQPSRVRLAGLPNYGKVSKQLSRGAQPSAAGFQELKKQGVGIVVNLVNETDAIASERALVQTQGMQYVSIPWRGSQNPDTGKIAQFLELLRANPDKQVFVHCERGAERTGVMVACYRMSVDGWTASQALSEMEQFGFRGMRFGHLKTFVRQFPSLLLSDPVLKNLGLRPGGGT
jgi:protein tyrosine/serine phosphatase